MERREGFISFQTKITVYILMLVLLIQLTSAVFYFNKSDELISSGIQASSAGAVSNFMQDIRAKLGTLKSVEERKDFLRVYLDLIGSNFFSQFRGQSRDLEAVTFIDENGRAVAGDRIRQDDLSFLMHKIRGQEPFSVLRFKQLFVFEPLVDQGSFYGGIILQYTNIKIDRERGSLFLFVLISILVFSLLGIIGSFIISLEISRPVKKLLEGVEAIGAGRFEGEIRVFENDEIGLLCRGINKMTRSLKVAQDLMKKYNAELELKVDERTRLLTDSREFLDRIINNIASPIFVKDSDHRWILLNDPYCDFMGYKKEELIGKSDVDFFPKEEARVFWQKDQLVFDSGQINVNEESFTDARGQQHIIITRKVPFVQRNGEKILVGIINDITDQKNNEHRILKLNEDLQDSNAKLKDAYDQLARSERLAALGEMAAMVGHELRNSLGVIRNSVYFLKLRLPQLTGEEKLLKYLDILEKEIGISDKVIGGILTFNRLKQPVLQPHNINAVIVEVLEKMHFPKCIQKELALELSLPEIAVDADQLGRVFMNIAGNALDAMPNGGKLSVKTFRQDRWLAVSFADTGVGIAQEELSRIFKPGFTTKQHGSGLGLAICESILSMHNGKIEARSVAGQGTEILVYLPYQVS